VLKVPGANLWPGSREDVLAYFDRHGIVWHGGKDSSLGHLLSSQVACANHLGPLRGREDAATALLSGLDPEVERAEPVPEASSDAAHEGYVAFEFTGHESRLGEGRLIYRRERYWAGSPTSR
jgi:hypothetical protein